MSRLSSPLRYPGGKACLLGLMNAFLKENDLSQRVYVEPYSGGCGLALSLLFNGHVSQLHLNDIDRSIWAFWTAVTKQTDGLLRLISDTDVTVAEWEKQRLVQSYKDTADILELGYSTFFLNRTNRSGIIHSGGIIGGKNQSGDWKIDCRFNKADLSKRISRVAAYANRIFLYNEDAEMFMDNLPNIVPANSVIYIDPPYYEKGSQLYRNFYRPKDHSRIAGRISNLHNPWLMTYDNVEQIRELYSEFDSLELDIGYSVQTKRRGSEIMIVGRGLKLPVENHASAH